MSRARRPTSSFARASNGALSRGLVLVGLATLFTLGEALASPAIFGFTAAGGPFPRDAVGEPPADAHLPAPAVDPRACASCHADVAAEWQESMHGRSFSDPIFQAEFRESRNRETCAGCHAPLAASAAEEPAIAAVGIACAACHVRGGAILGAREAPRTSPHAVRVVPELADSTFCAGCHDFPFPPMPTTFSIPFATDIPQQASYAEWRSSHAASEGRTCASCHMPEVRRARGGMGRSHRMADLRDPALMASALDVVATAARDGASVRVRLVLSVRGAGHAVPTGDIFRLLRVRVANDRGQAERTLARRFAESWSGTRWERRDSVDQRVMPGAPRTVELALPLDDSDVRYELAILRLEPAAARRRHLDEASVVVPLASGRISAPPAPPNP